MGAIMRDLALSPVPRQLRRQSAPGPAAPVPAPAPMPVPPASAQPAQSPPATEPDPRRAREALAAELADTRRATLQQLAAMRAEAERRGYAAGEQRGEAAARAALQSEVERATALAAGLAEAKAAIIDDAEEAALELAFGAVCRILGEGAASREAVLRMVRAGAAAMREQGQVCIRLHPLDLELLEQGATGPATELGYRADASIKLGGCMVDSGAGTLDARLETQVERLRATLVAVRAARQQSPEAA